MAGIKCCKNCEKRHPGCHSDCSEYLAERKQYEQEKENAAKQKMSNPVLNKNSWLGAGGLKRGKRKY